MTRSPSRRASLEDFWAIPEAQRFHELIGGELVEKAAPSGEHGDAQAGIVGAVRPAYHRSSGGVPPGGWWIATEVEVLLLGTEIARPDVVGWRRDLCPDRPTGFPVATRPDWICEVVSPSNVTDDTIKKMRLYHRAGIGHYWLADPRDCTLTVMRWSADGYVTRLAADIDEVVRAEPFEAITISVGTLFGRDPIAE